MALLDGTEQEERGEEDNKETRGRWGMKREEK